MMKQKLFLLVALLCAMAVVSSAQRQMEKLNRGLVAVKVSNGVYLSWRFLPTDHLATDFKIYRDGMLIDSITIGAATNYTDKEGTAGASYYVKPEVYGEVVVEDSTSAAVWSSNRLVVQLQRPDGGVTPPSYFDNRNGSNPERVSYPDGEAYTYSPNDCSVADVDGDGEYEIIVKWDPSNSRDNSHSGMTGTVFLDAYKLNGTFLWRINLGINIRAGAHYTQFMVYDFDGDGKAEVVCKTAPGTMDAQGKKIVMGEDDPDKDWRTTSMNADNGYVLNGQEYLTLFSGETGAELHTVAYEPERVSSSSWGDGYGNRVDRFLACVAYLDGVRPSVVMCRGYYTRATLAAYDVVDKKLVKRWFYDSGSTAGVGAYGQGNHNLSVADVDDDSKDEIIYGSCVIDNDGKFMYRTGFGHGDALHVGKMLPDREGLQVFQVHEEKSSAYGYELHDAKTGEVIWGKKTGTDVGRGMAADIDTRYSGYEMWADNGTYDNAGNLISSKRPSVNFRIYWDDDLQDELLDGNKLDKWNGNGTTRLVTFDGSSINTTKANPCVSADILGDWREEVILYDSNDPSKIVLYTTTIPTVHRYYTLMSDYAYRLAVAWQNVAYNQPPHLSVFLPDAVDELKNRVVPEPPVMVAIRLNPAGGTFDDGSMDVRTIKVQVDKPFSNRIPSVSMEGYDFLGWSFAGGVPYKPDTTLSKTTTLVAEWKQQEDTTVQPPTPTAVAGNAWDNLLLYPNPTVNEQVILLGLLGGETISVVNLSGNVVLTRKAVGRTEVLQVGHLPQGTYVVAVAKNGYIKALKLVVGNK